jgi:hypothetical protein
MVLLFLLTTAMRHGYFLIELTRVCLDKLCDHQAAAATTAAAAALETESMQCVCIQGCIDGVHAHTNRGQSSACIVIITHMYSLTH